MAISAQQFAELQRRVAGVKTASGKAKRPAAETISVPASGVILGIDPSLRGTGYGVIRLAKARPVLLAYGTLECPASWTRSRCLAHIASSLREVVREHRPDVCAIEGLFFAQNLQTALIMGEARGAALAVIAEALVPIYEISPRKVKQAIVGHGGAQKLAVARMVQRLLALAELPAPDAADALALALAFAQETGRHVLTPPKRV